MNIFYLHEDTATCARQHNDKHCVKMILEYAQLMSTAHHQADSPIKHLLYKQTHINHPSAIWARESKANYEWLYQLFVELCQEYTYRYGKVHKTFSDKSELLSNVPDLPDIGLTEIPKCMPDACKVGNVLESYREYYRTEKQSLGTWKNRETPDWWATC